MAETGLGLGSYFRKKGFTNNDVKILLENSLFVSKNGNDPTAIRNDLNKTYLTITAAKNAAQAGDTIFIYPGDYDEADLLATDVNYHFFTGANIIRTGADGTAIFKDNNIVTTNTFIIDTIDTSANTGFPPIFETQVSSNFVINANILKSLDCVLNVAGGSIINMNANIYSGINCQIGTSNVKLIVDTFEESGLDLFDDCEIEIIFNYWVRIIRQYAIMQIGGNAKCKIFGNYINTNIVFGSPIGGFILQQNSETYLNIQLWEASGDQPIFRSNLEGNIKATFEGVFIHTGVNARSIIAEFIANTGNIVLPNGFTFKNFQGRVDSSLANSIFSPTNNVDVKYLSAFANKNDNVKVISKILASNIKVDPDV